MESICSKSKELCWKLDEDEDEFKWLKSKCSNIYKTKLGYYENMEEDEAISKKWW